MKKRYLFLVVLLIFTIMSSVSFAQQLTSSQARWNVSKKFLGFGAGLVAGLYFHELGHEVVSETNDIDLIWSPMFISSSHKSDDDVVSARIACGGFGFQVLITEIILNADFIPKDNSFVIGWLFYNIVNVFTYTARHETSPDGYGDFRSMEKNGLNPRIVEPILITHAIFSAYRLWAGGSDFPLYIESTNQEIEVGFKVNF